jgi:membrane protein implicated in regulation of membrane protease activity
LPATVTLTPTHQATASATPSATPTHAVGVAATVTPTPTFVESANLSTTDTALLSLSSVALLVIAVFLVTRWISKKGKKKLNQSSSETVIQ